ncbi:unnamed protein product [Candida verbasci]|uniref:Uncharacterized protein n=1 Tax=Candida verbasci TaxID=1227364 RepID=A0A9W4TX91_9ASCO|nr:unnamed protein product [Candida verbasci]
MKSILFINPNSSIKVTTNLKQSLVVPDNTNITYYTAPKDAPLEITNNITAKKSEEIVIKDLIDSQLLTKFDGFIIGCYSDHPLIKSVGEISHKPCMGIFQATILYSLSNPSINKSIILTSSSEWENTLNESIIDFLGVDQFPSRKFVKTRGLNVKVNNLADDDQYKNIKIVVDDILTDKDINCVLLGCAGMAGLDLKLKIDYPNTLFIDSCKIAVELLSGLIRFGEYA